MSHWISLKNYEQHTPRVSVIRPANNDLEFTHHAENSVLNQLFNDLELILFDDGCTDGTRDIMVQVAYFDPVSCYLIV